MLPPHDGHHMLCGKVGLMAGPVVIGTATAVTHNSKLAKGSAKPAAVPAKKLAIDPPVSMVAGVVRCATAYRGEHGSCSFIDCDTIATQGCMLLCSEVARPACS
jgi:hypothetical protein